MPIDSLRKIRLMQYLNCIKSNVSMRKYRIFSQKLRNLDC